MSRILVIRGESYVTLRHAAEYYECEVAWVREVYDLGLLGPGEEIEGETSILAHMLDRLAEVVRLSVHQGLDLAGVAALLDVD